MKDEFDSSTAGAFTTLEELAHPVFVQEALATGGHYQAVRILPEMIVSGRLSFIHGESGKPIYGNNKGSVIFIMRKLKEGESQVTRYVTVSEICPHQLQNRCEALGG